MFVCVCILILQNPGESRNKKVQNWKFKITPRFHGLSGHFSVAMSCTTKPLHQCLQISMFCHGTCSIKSNCNASSHHGKTPPVPKHKAFSNSLCGLVAYFWCSTNMGRFQLSFYIFNSKTLWKIDGGVRKAEILDGEEPAYTWGIFCVQKKTKPCQSTGNEVPKKQWNQQTWGVKLFKCDLRQVGWFHS